MTGAATGGLIGAAGDGTAGAGSEGYVSAASDVTASGVTVRDAAVGDGALDSAAASRAGSGGAGAGSGPGVPSGTAFGAAALELGRAAAEVGRAHRALDRVMASVLVALRAVALALTVFYLIVWDWYLDHPVAAAVLGATVLWHLVFCLLGARRGVGRGLAGASVALALPLSVAARLVLPSESVGDSGNFVFLAVVNASVAAVWAFPRRPAAALVLLLAAGAFVGGWGRYPQVVAQAVLLVMAPGLLGMSIGRLRHIARTADRRWANVVARHRGEAVVLAVARDRRERERVIHDTVLNTLTGLAWGGGRDVALARRRCAQSLVAVRDLLDPGPDTGPALDERIAEVVAEATGRGLVVDLTSRLESGPPGPPGVVVSAFAGAVGEALANVERHSGSRYAWVSIDGGPDEVTVRVRDIGRGFEPSLVDPARLGLRRSITGRLEDVAGTVGITSTPGCGTTVELRWRTPRIVATPRGEPPAGRARGGFVPDRRDVAAIAADLRSAYTAGLRRAVGNVAGAWLLLMVAPLVATLHWVREPAVGGVLWGALAVVIVVARMLVRRRPLSGGEALLMLAIAGGSAVCSAANTRGADIVRIANWPWVVLPLLLAFVTASRPAREWIGALGGAVALVTGLVLIRDAHSPLVIARLGSLIYGCCAVQIITAMLGPLLRRTAMHTAHVLAAEAELAANIDSSAMIRRERLSWLRAVQRDVLPLLAEVADGRLDPGAPAVRGASAARAAAIRRMLTGGGPSSALADLDPVLADAESAGISVEIQRSGDLRTAPAPGRAALADRVGEVLAVAGRGRAIVTVMWLPAGGSIYVTMPWPDGLALPETVRGAMAGGEATGDAGSPAVRLGTVVELDDRRLSLELTWPALEPAWPAQPSGSRPTGGS
ncbi:ATP-binding protein [Frankia sp. AiPa1]|uniref:ATP-binding protein n=1 Tax=Frankia sp. AiPa1 TaxID=573492 RepID=UPI00202AF125|nr:ATP-binding protein [Frankia sp. AiPa1]